MMTASWNSTEIRMILFKDYSDWIGNKNKNSETIDT